MKIQTKIETPCGASHRYAVPEEINNTSNT